MKRTSVTELEAIIRRPAQTNFNAIILEVGLDSVVVKTPPGSRKIKRNVELAEHIKAKRHLLKAGIPCQLEKRQGKLYVVAIFEEGLEQAGALTGSTSDLSDPTNPANQTGLQTPRPQAAIDCENEAWQITWEAIENAAGYEVYWTADNSDRPADAGEPVATSEETEVSVAFDTAEPGKVYFSVRAVGQNGLKSAYSPWVTAELTLTTPPGGFSACPVPGGYRLNVDPEQDTTQNQPAFDHWELEWADDDQGLNGSKWGDLTPADLPKFISAQPPGSWTFDADTDESWGHVHAASPSDWDGDGATSPGSRIVYDGGDVPSGEIPAENQWFSGSVMQAMNQFTGVAGDKITLKVKLTRSGGSGSFAARAHLNAGIFDTTSVDLTTGGSIDEFQASDYATPPFTYVELEADGTWQDLELTLPAEAVGKPVGYLRIKISCQGVPLDSILVDDIHWGPGGIKPATEKWFRLRAAWCAGLFGPWTDWTSGRADQAIFTLPDLHGTVHSEDKRYRFVVGQGYIKRSEDGGETYTDLTANLPELPANDTELTNLEFFQVLQSPTERSTFFFLARWNGKFWVLRTTDLGLEDWAWKMVGGKAPLTDGTYYYPDEFYREHEANWTGNGPRDILAAEGYAQVTINNPDQGVGLPDQVGAEFIWSAGTSYSVVIYATKFSLALDGASLQMRVRVLNANLGWFRNPQLWFSADGQYYYGGLGLSWDASTLEDGWIYSNWVTVGAATKPAISVALRSEVPWGYGYTSANFPYHGFVDTFQVRNVTAVTGGPGGYPIWADVSPDGETLSIVSVKNGMCRVEDYDTATLTFDEAGLTDITAMTEADAVNGYYRLHPRYLESGDLLLYGRALKDSKITYLLTRTVAGDLAAVLTEDDPDWLPQDYAGAVLQAQLDQLLLVRHTSFRSVIDSAIANTITYGLVDTEGNPAASLKAGQYLYNLTRLQGYGITDHDGGMSEITLDTAPATWLAGDEIFAWTGAELWGGEAANLTAVLSFSLLLANLPLTVLPDGATLTRSQLLLLGNRLLDEVMIEQLELPYSTAVDKTADFSVPDGIVAIKFAESGCEAETSNLENEDVPPIQPPPPGSNEAGGGGGSGMVAVVSPLPGSNQPAQIRNLRHDELSQLLDDDHPQYLNQTRGDARYSQLGHNHGDLYYTEAETDTLLAGKADTGHLHDDRYYTESEADALLADKSDVGHTHEAGTGDMLKSVYDTDDDGVVDAAEAAPWAGITDKPATFPPEAHNHDDLYYTEAEADTLLAGKSDTTHLHDDRYYTETETYTKDEVDGLLAGVGGKPSQLWDADGLGVRAEIDVDLNLAVDNAIGAGGNITGATLGSNVATGTPPLNVVSTTKVDNLNADMVDGTHLDQLVTKLSTNRPGVVRLYRRDDDSPFSVQASFDGTYWRLNGYDGSDAFHAGTRVSLADSAGNAETVDYKHEYQLRGYGTYVYCAVAQSLPYNTWTTLNLAGGGYYWNEASGWDGATAIYAQQTGWHFAYGQFTQYATATTKNNLLMRLMINGGYIYGGEKWMDVGSNGSTISLGIPIYLVQGQYIQFQAFQLTGNPGVTGPNYASRFTIMALVRL